uniref:Uncharacterized protein n=1 Tax=Anguilla anguilla TaxID=7936 RepID=A0A0E9VW14_ANGAN
MAPGQFRMACSSIVQLAHLKCAIRHYIFS